MKKGPLIVFSGLDGAGKSTQIRLLMGRLESEARRPICLWTRGGYTTGFNALKSLLRRMSRGRAVPASGDTAERRRAFGNPSTRRLWLRLALLDLIRVYAIQLRWWRWRGLAVVCDRYLWDTLIDFRLNFPQESVEKFLLWKVLRRLTPEPDAAFLMLVPVEESVRRSDIKGEPYRDSPETLAARLAEYEALAERGYWRVLDGRREVSDLAAEINASLAGRAGPGRPAERRLRATNFS